MLGSYSHLQNKRNIDFTGFSASAKATIPSWQVVPHLGVGYIGLIRSKDQCKTFFVEPFAAVDWALSWINSYKEKGASPFNFSQNGSSVSLLRGEGGLKFVQEISYSWGTLLLEERASYVNKTPFSLDDMTVALIGAPGDLALSTFQEVQHLGSAGLSLTTRWGSQFDQLLHLSYQGEFGSGYISNQINVKFTKEF